MSFSIFRVVLTPNSVFSKNDLKQVRTGQERRMCQWSRFPALRMARKDILDRAVDLAVKPSSKN